LGQGGCADLGFVWGLAARAKFHEGDFLVFGRETKGLPENLLAKNMDNCVTIPMHGTRSLNLATTVAIVLFEAVRQQA